VARHREFDYDRALDRAMRLFWAKGYSNTSLRDLLKVMRIGEGSFYHLVSGKKALYLLCLKRYNDIVTIRRLEVLESEPSIRRAVRKFFACVLDELDNPKTPRVCLMAGSLSGDVLAERDLERYVLGEMSRFEAAFVSRLDAAIRAGELPAGFPSRTAAQVLITFLQGLFRVIRVMNSRQDLERQLDVILRGLGL
jgi:TetR/AcrR family transcriptional repressor of nem operon